jgi:hypothetical protein
VPEGDIQFLVARRLSARQADVGSSGGLDQTGDSAADLLCAPQLVGSQHRPSYVLLAVEDIALRVDSRDTEVAVTDQLPELIVVQKTVSLSARELLATSLFDYNRVPSRYVADWCQGKFSRIVS